MDGKVITQNDINSIIESINQQNTLIVSVTNNISKMAAKIKSDDLAKSAKKFKKIENSLESYMSLLNSIIDTICIKGDSKGLSEILGYYEETKNADGSVKPSGYTVVDATAQISNVLNNIIKGIDAVAKFKFNFKTILTLRMKIKMFAKMTQTLLINFANSFKNTGIDTKELLSGLVAEPDFIHKTVKDLTQVNKDEKMDKTKLNKIEEETTRKGKLGLLDALTMFINIITSINAFQVPNLSKFKLKMKLFKIQIGIMLKCMNETLKSLDQKRLEELNIQAKSIEKIQEIFMNLNMSISTIMNTIDVFSKKNRRKKNETALNNLNLFLSGMRDLLMSEYISQLSGKTVEDIVKNSQQRFVAIKDMMTKLNVICRLINVCAVSAKLATFLINPIIKFIPKLGELIDVLEKLNENKADFKSINENLISLTTSIGLLAAVSLELVVLGVAMLPFIVLYFPIKLGLDLLSKVLVGDGEEFGGIVGIVDDIAKKIDSDSAKNILEILAIIGSLILISIAMVGLAAVILPAAIASWVVAGALWVMKIAFNLIFKFIKLIAKGITPKMHLNLLKLLLVVGVLCLIAIGMTVLGILSVMVIINALNILIFFGVLVLSIVGILAIGALMTLLTPILPFIVPGLLYTIILIGILDLLALELIYLSSIKLDKELILQNVDNIFDVVDAIIEKLSTPVQLFNEEKGGIFAKAGNWLASRFKQIADTITMIMEMPRLLAAYCVVGQLKDLVDTLNELQNLKLDSDKITTNVTLIFTTINDIITNVNANKDIEIEEDFEKFRKVNSLTEILKEITGQLGEFSKLNIKDMTGKEGVIGIIQTNINGLLGIMFEKRGDVIDNLYKWVGIDLIKPARKLRRFTRIMKEIAENLNKMNSKEMDFSGVAESFGKFIDKINGTDASKLKQATSMFRQMAKFSESINGNFDKMADSLNEKIMPLLEELKELLEKVPESMEKAEANTAGAIGDLQASMGSPKSKSEIASQVARENPGISGQDLDKEIDNRVRKQMAHSNSGITSKIDAIIDILTQGTGKIQTA